MNGQIGGVDLAKLGIRGVTVNECCRHSWHVKQAVTGGGHFVEPDIEGENQIRIGEQLFHVGKHANTSIASIAGAVIVNDVMKAERRHNRDIGSAGEGLDLPRRLILPTGAAKKDYRPAGRCPADWQAGRHRLRWEPARGWLQGHRDAPPSSPSAWFREVRQSPAPDARTAPHSKLG